MQDKAPDSPIKGRQHLKFNHFSHSFRAELGDSNIFHTRFNSDASLIAASLFDGSLQIYSTMFGEQLFKIQDDEMNFPITSLTWKPTLTDSMDGQQILGSCLNGSIIRWQPKMGNNVEHIVLNEANKFHAIDYAGDTRKFVVAGSQPYIEIYDESRMTKVQQIGNRIFPAHTNKIFTCKFNPNAPNQLISGSWDRQVRFWDLRANEMTASIGGKTSISGCGVDISYDNNYVVTGGGTLGEGVNLWDMRDLENPIKEFNWSSSQSGDILNPVVNCVQFVPKKHLVLVGVSDDTVSAKCLDTLTGGTVDQFNHVEGNCFSLDVARDASICAFGDSKGTLHFENIHYSE